MSTPRPARLRAPSTGDLERELDLLQILHAMNGIQSEFVSVVRGMQVNGVLWSGTAQMDTTGTWGHSFSVPFAYVHIFNVATHPVSVTNDPIQTSAPPFGVGLKLIPAGQKFGFNLAGRHLAIYGTAGDLVNVEVHTKPLEPD